jgi:hypothetical protein
MKLFSANTKPTQADFRFFYHHRTDNGKNYNFEENRARERGRTKKNNLTTTFLSAPHKHCYRQNEATTNNLVSFGIRRQAAADAIVDAIKAVVVVVV